MIALVRTDSGQLFRSSECSVAAGWVNLGCPECSWSDEEGWARFNVDSLSLSIPAERVLRVEWFEDAKADRAV